MDGQAAEILALEALSFLASDEKRLGALLAQAGWSVEDLRRQAGEPHVLAGILDFLLGHEPFLLAFCEAADRTTEDVRRARRALPGVTPE